jgi:hypothetical protein
MTTTPLWIEAPRACGHATWVSPNGWDIDAADAVRVAALVAELAGLDCPRCARAAHVSTRRLCWGE